MRFDIAQQKTRFFPAAWVGSGFCVLLVLLGAWGSPEWFSRFPLVYAGRFMDALSVYAFSCAAYFCVRLCGDLRGLRLSRVAVAAVFAACFLPVAALSVLNLADRGLDTFDAYRGIPSVFCWTIAAAAALPVVLPSKRGAGGSNRGIRVAGAILAAWLLVTVSFVVRLFVDVPGLIPAGASLALFAGASVVLFVVPGRGPADNSLIDGALSPREREVVALLLDGKTNREIADALFISLPTVKTHLSSIFNKTGARNRMEVARLARAADRPKV